MHTGAGRVVLLNQTSEVDNVVKNEGIAPLNINQMHGACVQGLKELPYSYLSITAIAFLTWIKLSQVGRTQHWRKGWVSLSGNHHPHQLMILMILLLLSHITPPILTSIPRGIYRASEAIEVLTSI